MHDIVDVIKNIQTLAGDDSAFKILKDFERVLDELDLYVFDNWENGELIEGPTVTRYHVSCKFMWPHDDMPNPEGGERLLDYGCKVLYKKSNILVPRKVYKPSDFRPGTKKGKIDPHPIWIVEIIIPKKLMQDIFTGKELKDNVRYADSMRDQQSASIENPNEGIGAEAAPLAPEESTAPEQQIAPQ